MKLDRDSESATSGKLLQCVADGDTDAEKCAETASITLSNKQTLSIANISDGVTYTIKETGLPNGYVFESAQSSNLTGTIQRSSGIAAVVVGNVYQPNSITLVAVVGSATGSYPFEFQLQAAQGTPLPTCGTADTCSVSDVDANGNHVMKKTLTYQTSGERSQSMTFGDITFTKPGTYTYSLSEITPSSGALQGFNYSRAQYVVTVTVAVEDGNLVVAGVKTVRT